jgi:hypothetical protein
MKNDNFDLFVTINRNLAYQQNIEKISITIIVLCANDNRLETLKELILKIFEILAEGNFQDIIEVY